MSAQTDIETVRDAIMRMEEERTILVNALEEIKELRDREIAEAALISRSPSQKRKRAVGSVRKGAPHATGGNLVTAQRRRENALLRANGWETLGEILAVNCGVMKTRKEVLRSIVTEAATSLVVSSRCAGETQP